MREMEPIKMPTDKQIEYATEISNLLDVPMPIEQTRKAYTDFIGYYQNEYKREKKERERRARYWSEEDL